MFIYYSQKTHTLVITKDDNGTVWLREQIVPDDNGKKSGRCDILQKLGENNNDPIEVHDVNLEWPPEVKPTNTDPKKGDDDMGAGSLVLA